MIASAVTVPVVSVVVIVRNGERFLAEALESIRAQTMEAWEAVVVDDGSTDGTAAVIARFVAEDPARFRGFTHAGRANLGMSASRNLGLQHARAGYVTFLDHDDVMEPTKLERQVDVLARNPSVGAVVGPNLRWYSWSTSGGDRDRGTQAEDHVQSLGVELDAVHAPPGLLPAFLERTSATPQAPMVRADVIRAIGGFEAEFRGMYEDQVFLAKLALVAPVHVHGEVLQRYRQHDASCVRVAHRAGAHLEARRLFLDWLARWLSDRSPALGREQREALLAAVRRQARALRVERWKRWFRFPR